ncbi:hypothetical protein [Paenibacillus sp. UNC451MF]|uniref:hypothetical protein n=1 Tax=Paenibacillus sp. UNC451MF TaxID=1449063 RepID=UPI0004907C51|nr:hypothetical protein [Paenibacillus sp. UNC451MF]
MTTTQFENDELFRPVGHGGEFYGGHGDAFHGGGFHDGGFHGGGFHGGDGGFYPEVGYINPFIVPIVVTDDGRYYQYPHPYPYPYYPYSYPYY